MTMALDPVLSRVIARSLESICTEMGSAMIRTAVSAVFAEGRDFSCALLDPRAELVATANYDPSHLSAMALTTEYALIQLGWEELEEGDVILVNDPYRGGGHLPDICVIRPIYVDGDLLAIAINRGHHIDVGGMAVAGFPGTARSIFHEGIRIPPVKWFEAGVERPQVMDLVLLNVRFPRAQLGDFRAQLASCITAEQRLRELAERYGSATVAGAMGAAKEHSERLMRNTIAELDDGSYRFADAMDDDGLGRGPYRIAVEIRIEGDQAMVDFNGTSGQAEGPINSSYGNTVGSVFNAFLHTVGGGIPFNHGCFRPLDFEVPRGSMLNPIPPASVFGGVTETSIRIIDAVCGALAEAVPDRVAAGSYGTCINLAGGGWDETRGEEYGFYFFQEGGWGATSWRDGWSSVPNPTSNFNDYPAEIVESTLPLRCVEVALNEGSGGPGRFRGGLGTRRVYELLSDHSAVNALGDRFEIPPHGVRGGYPAVPTQLLVQRPGSDPSRFDDAFGLASRSKFSSVALRRGDCVHMITGGGGGYGDPFERDPELVRADVREGLVGERAAREEYGVALELDGDEWLIDSRATAELRSRPRKPAERVELEAVPPRVPGGREADDVARVRELAAHVDERIGADPCETVCPKQGDPVRCPFHHAFATRFWDAESLEAWAKEHCVIVRAEPLARRAPELEGVGP